MFYPPAPPVFATFWIVLFSSPCYRPPSLAVVVIVSLCHTISLTPFQSQNSVHLDVAHTRYPLASAARLCAPLRVPASTTVSCACSLSPLASPGLHLGTCWPLGVFLPRVPPSSLCPVSLSVCCTASWHLLGPGISRCPFRARARGQGASTTCQLPALAPAPPIHG